MGTHSLSRRFETEHYYDWVRDVPRLDRAVAIKVFPEHIAKRDDPRVRFEREARTAASLNHPHIRTLYAIGPGYRVMDLIEGESLAARIENGPMAFWT